MEFGLSEEQRLLVATVRRFVDAELIPLEDGIETTGELAIAKSREIFEKSRALGFYAMNIPAEYGGGGLSAVDTMLVEEQFGRAKDILIRRAFGNVYESLLKGTPAQKERWLLPAVRGERTCSIAITEPDAGSDAAAIRTRAVKRGDGWILDGHKHFISDGLHSDFFIVSAVTDAAQRPRHVSLFLVDKSLPGLNVWPALATSTSRSRACGSAASTCWVRKGRVSRSPTPPSAASDWRRWARGRSARPAGS